MEGNSVRFSSLTHGSRIVLSEDGLEARKEGPYYYDGTGVYMATPLKGSCEIELEVMETCSSGSLFENKDHKGDIGSLVIGIGQSPKGSHKHIDLPHKIGRDSTGLCYWCRNRVFNCLLGGSHLEAANLCDNGASISYPDLLLMQGDAVGLRLRENGDLSFIINQKELGVVATDVYSEDYDIYPVVSLNDSIRAVRIIRAVLQPSQLNKPESISLNTVDFGFHPETGMNIVLFEDGRFARRVNPCYLSTSARSCLVYGALPVNHCSTCVFEVVIAESDHGRVAHAGSIGIGVLRTPCGSELKWSDLPRHCKSSRHHSWVWCEFKVNNLTSCQYSLVGLSALEEGDRVGLQVSSNRELSLFVNDVDLGVAARGVLREGYNVYPLVHIHGNCNAIRINRAEIYCEVPDLQELCMLKILSCIGWELRDVRCLPLPRGLVKQIEQQIKTVMVLDE